MMINKKIFHLHMVRVKVNDHCPATEWRLFIALILLKFPGEELKLPRWCRWRLSGELREAGLGNPAFISLEEERPVVSVA